MTAKKRPKGKKRIGGLKQSSTASKEYSDRQELENAIPPANPQNAKGRRRSSKLAPSKPVPIVSQVKDQPEPTQGKTSTWDKILRAATLAGVTLTGVQTGYQVLHDAGAISFVQQAPPTLQPTNPAESLTWPIETSSQTQKTESGKDWLNSLDSPVPPWTNWWESKLVDDFQYLLQHGGGQQGVIQRDTTSQWRIVFSIEGQSYSEPLVSGSSLYLLLNGQYVTGHFIQTEDENCYFVDTQGKYTTVFEGMEVATSTCS